MLFPHFITKLTMQQVHKELILSLSKQACTANYTHELAIGKLYLEALITKIIFTDTDIFGDAKQDRSSVLTTIQSSLEGLNEEQIAVVVGKLYAGVTQQQSYGKAIEWIVREAIQKATPLNHLEHEDDYEYSQFELDSQTSSNATFSQNESVPMDFLKTSPKYMEKIQTGQTSLSKNSPKYTEKIIQTSPIRRSPQYVQKNKFEQSPQKKQYIEKTPEYVKQIPFAHQISPINPRFSSPFDKKPVYQNIHNCETIQEPVKSYVEPVKGSVQTPEPESAPLHSVDAYLQQIPVFRTEINLVSQFMKLPAIKYYRFRYNDRYYVRSEFKIRGYWTYYKPLEFYGEGWSPIYRQACEHAAYQVLRVLFMYCPELWHKFIELKKRRGFQ